MKLTYDDSVIKKHLYLLLFLIIFFQTFIVHVVDNWEVKYKLLGVPANTFPGGDARNIQNAAFCASLGYSYYNNRECKEEENLIKKIYPKYDHVPLYNYPPIVADVYRLFNNRSERFFLDFWKFNVLMLLITILIYSYKINYKLFPLILFSPVTLLAIERGNIEAITFSVLFIPLLLTSSLFVQSFFIGIASAIKVFPIIGYIALLKSKLKDIYKIFLGGAIALPLIVYTLLYIPEYINNTLYGFYSSFGLTSLKNSRFIDNHIYLYPVGLLIFLLFSSTILYFIFKSKPLITHLQNELMKIPNKQFTILLVSLIIYIYVFLSITSWAYRFIFLIPAMLVLSNVNNSIAKVSFWLISIAFWVPIIPYGWYLFNIMGYLLVPFLFVILILSVQGKYGYLYEK